MSLRLRITLVVVLVVTAAVAVVGQRVYAAAERELVEEVDIEVQGRAAGFGTIVSGPQFREAFTRSALQDLAADGFFERRDSQSFLDQTARDNFFGWWRRMVRRSSTSAPRSRWISHRPTTPGR